MEILFEQDNEEKSVASLILDCLVKVELHYTVIDKNQIDCSSVLKATQWRLKSI